MASALRALRLGGRHRWHNATVAAASAALTSQVARSPASTPLSTSSTRKTGASSPSATDGLLACNFGVFALQLLTRNRVTSALMKVNALMRPQPWRFATAALVHGSLMHLLVNSVSLSDIGHTFESLCGRDRTLAVYGCSAVCGNAISVFLNSNNALGASGAIMGLAGAFATTLGVNRRFLSPQAMEMRNTILRVVAINLAIGGVARGMVDNWGHIGGLLGGIASAYCFGPRLKRRGLQIVDEPPIPTFASTGSLARLTLRRLPPELR